MKNVLLFVALMLSTSIFTTLSAQESASTSYSSVTTTPQPLFIVDGKEMDSFKLNNVKPDDIESMSVYKGDEAINRYGSKGANGVIVITTKKSASKSTDVKIESNGNTLNPIYMVDGNEVKRADLDKIDPNTIESMSVFKGDDAINRYGSKGSNGVIEITLKK